MKKINGNVKKYVLINSTRYNEDGRYSVQVCNFDELGNLGFDKEEREKIEEMDVDCVMQTDYVGCYLIRIA